MGDLIDRDALGVGPANPEVFKNTAYADGWNALIKIIKQAPAIDAAPVVHGQWIWHEDVSLYECSACHCQFDYYHTYCPNCGAKSDGEGDAE